MKKIYFTPGPSQLYPTAYKHFQTGFKNNVGSISHRGKEFEEVYKNLTSGLKNLLGIPKNYHIFIVGSGTEAIERTIQNCVEKYSFHFVNGAFSKRFFEAANELGKKPEKVDALLGEGFDFEKVVIPQKTELICFTHNESSTGVMTPVKHVNAISKKCPDALIAVDIVSSVPYVDLDYRLLDVVFFSVQKGFGLPAGMGILIVSPRAIKKAETLLQKGLSIGSYHNFVSVASFAEKIQTPETPPVMEMYVLGKVIEDMQTIGIEKIRKDTEKKAALFYEFFDKSSNFTAFVKEKAFRSPTIIVVDVQKVKGNVRKSLSEKGFFVGSGYGNNKETHIRISNFPAHSVRDVKKLIRYLKAV